MVVLYLPKHDEIINVLEDSSRRDGILIYIGDDVTEEFRKLIKESPLNEHDEFIFLGFL